MEMKSALLLCSGMLMWTPEATEDAGLWGPQNIGLKSVPVYVILLDSWDVENAQSWDDEFSRAMEDVDSIILSCALK